MAQGERKSKVMYSKSRIDTWVLLSLSTRVVASKCIYRRRRPWKMGVDGWVGGLKDGLCGSRTRAAAVAAAANRARLALDLQFTARLFEREREREREICAFLVATASTCYLTRESLYTQCFLESVRTSSMQP